MIPTSFAVTFVIVLTVVAALWISYIVGTMRGYKKGLEDADKLWRDSRRTR